MTFDLDLAESVGGLIHLTVVVNEDEVWPHPGATDSGSDFEPEDILAWLTDAWASLHLEQSWPIPFTSQQEPRSITGFCGLRKSVGRNSATPRRIASQRKAIVSKVSCIATTCRR